MSQLIEMNTADLIGLALDYATGIADGRELELPGAVRGRTGIVWCDPFVIKLEGRPDFHDKTRRKWSPSTDWSQGGPLIEKSYVTVGSDEGSNRLMYWAYAGFASDGFPCMTGETHLVATCRAIVAAKLGDTVSIPAELII